jgi:hypothetical protein
LANFFGEVDFHQEKFVHKYKRLDPGIDVHSSPVLDPLLLAVVDVLGNDKDGLSNRVKCPLAPVLDGPSPELELVPDYSGRGVAQNLRLVVDG